MLIDFQEVFSGERCGPWASCQCILAILLSLPLRKGHGPSFEQTWIPFILGCFNVHSLVEISPVVLEKVLKHHQTVYYCYFDIFSPLIIISSFKRVRTFIFQKKKRINWKLCAKFGWSCPSGSREDKIQYEKITNGQQKLTWALEPWTMHIFSLPNFESSSEICPLVVSVVQKRICIKMHGEKNQDIITPFDVKA